MLLLLSLSRLFALTSADAVDTNDDSIDSSEGDRKYGVSETVKVDSVGMTMWRDVVLSIGGFCSFA